MNKIQEQPCFKCFYFEEFDDSHPIIICPAHCNHDNCFKNTRIQNANGSISYQKTRTKDIIDLVDENNNCPFFKKFKLITKKKFLWFKTYEKVLIQENE